MRDAIHPAALGYADKQATARQAEIGDRLRRLETSLDGVSGLLDKLLERMVPAMRQSPPPGVNEVAKRDDSGTPLGMRLSGCIDTTDSIARRIDDALSRIEL